MGLNSEGKQGRRILVEPFSSAASNPASAHEPLSDVRRPQKGVLGGTEEALALPSPPYSLPAALTAPNVCRKQYFLVYKDHFPTLSPSFSVADEATVEGRDT